MSASFVAEPGAASSFLLASARPHSGNLPSESKSRPARVLIGARSAIRQAGLEKMLAETSEFRSVGTCPSLAALESRARQLAPELVLLDWDGETEAEDLAGTGRFAEHIRTVVLVDDPAAHLMAAMLRAGIRAIVPREACLSELMSALRAVLEGLIVLGSELARTLTDRLSHGGEFAATAPAEELTHRELQVLELLARGTGNKDIGAQLGISEHTVKFHIGSILSKLSASNRTEAVARGIHHGLIVV